MGPLPQAAVDDALEVRIGERWRDRSEAAKLLWACWRYRETQTVHVGSLKGQKVETDKRPLRHIARLILIGERGIFYRLAMGGRATTKRQTPVCGVGCSIV